MRSSTHPLDLLSSSPATRPSRLPCMAKTWCGFEPSAPTIHMAQAPPSFDAYAMYLPSGDQAGSPSVPRVFVNRISPDPSTLMTYTSQLPSRCDMKAIFEPSGEFAGAVSEPLSPRGVAPEPSETHCHQTTA